MASSLSSTQIGTIATKMGWSASRVQAAADDHTSQLQGDGDLLLLELISYIDTPPSGGGGTG